MREEKRKEGWKGGREGGMKRWEGEEFTKDHLAFLWILLGIMEAERTTESFQ